MGLKTLVAINTVWFSLKERSSNLLCSTRFVYVGARLQTFDPSLHERRIYRKCVGIKMELLILVWRHCGNRDIWYLGVISMTQILKKTVVPSISIPPIMKYSAALQKIFLRCMPNYLGDEFLASMRKFQPNLELLSIGWKRIFSIYREEFWRNEANFRE